MTTADKPLFIDRIDAAVDHVLDTVAGDIVLGMPLGIGKPNPFVNALYRRMKANPARRLRIVTALSLEKPVGHSDLEKHFLAPLVERVFADYPDLDYVKDLRAGRAAAEHRGARVLHEDRRLPRQRRGAAGLHLDQLHLRRARHGRAGHERDRPGGGRARRRRRLRLSLSSNPDVTSEVVERYAELGKPLLKVGVVNRQDALHAQRRRGGAVASSTWW
jgi:hypothetical protein